MWHQAFIMVESKGRGLIDITPELKALVAEQSMAMGLCHCFLQHTSASLLINENYDPSVQRDLGVFLDELVPDGDSRYQHTLEGPDDMAAHVKTALTQTELSIPITNSQLQLGTWQGVYIWEHRLKPHTRKVMVTMCGSQA